MPLLQTSGNVTADGYGGGVAAVPNYIEDVFSTYLYTGNAGTQTVTNGIDLSTKGGMVWIKSRSGAYPHSILDTVRGFNYSGTQTKRLDPSTTDSQADAAGNATQASPLSDGFSVTTSGGGAINSYNASGSTYASWTFRKQAKFFDVVTYTGNNTAGRTVAHNLGSVPGCIIVKCTSSSGAWTVYHRSPGATKYLILNNTDAETTFSGMWNNTDPTATEFTLGASGFVNAPGATYVAYLFAHNAGGFGLTGTDNVISCGSYTGNGSSTGPVIDLGYEPQWLLIKKADSATTNTGWAMFDNMRGLRNSGGVFLYANSSAAEDSSVNIVSALATGFQPVQSGFLTNGNGSTYIYIAIRRGPMKVPTSGTSVFSPNAINNATGTANTTGFPIDLQILDYRSGTAIATFSDRLRGVATTTTATSAPYLFSSSTAAEASSTSFTNNWGNTGFATPSDLNNFSGILWNFRRAPNFFDEVCYTGTGSATTVTHNLGVAPELMIVKSRSAVNNWVVYSQSIASGNVLFLNGTSGSTAGTTSFNSTAPTASVFTVGTNSATNGSGATLVAYLFATCAGVSKVGSYTGNGSTQTINCGFTGGARFVLIKRTDSTGNWYVYDTARGMTTLTDPYLLLNSTAAESATLGSVTTVSTGFAVDASILAAVNTNAASYIFLAIA